MSRPFSPRSSASSFVRINGKIRAREVRVIGPDGQQLGVLPLHEAINFARARDMDLVEVAPNAAPPVCRVIDYGKYRYEQAKKGKESRKHQHANRVKEIQLSPSIDPHDYGIKLGHAVDFLCEDMKVKVTLRFRGREMAHQEYGMQVLDRLIRDIAPYGHPDAEPKLVGRGLNVMLSPLPRNKRAKNPHAEATELGDTMSPEEEPAPLRQIQVEQGLSDGSRTAKEQGSPSGFSNNPFEQLDSQLGPRSAA